MKHIKSKLSAGHGTCRCAGDPHCYSTDGRPMSFMGACQYTLIRDGCEGGAPTGDKTFEVVVDFWRRGLNDLDNSYVKEVTATFGNTVGFTASVAATTLFRLILNTENSFLLLKHC